MIAWDPMTIAGPSLPLLFPGNGTGRPGSPFLPCILRRRVFRQLTRNSNALLQLLKYRPNSDRNQQRKDCTSKGLHARPTAAAVLIDRRGGTAVGGVRTSGAGSTATTGKCSARLQKLLTANGPPATSAICVAKDRSGTKRIDCILITTLALRITAVRSSFQPTYEMIHPAVALQAVRASEMTKKPALNTCKSLLRVHPCSISSRRQAQWFAIPLKCLGAGC